MAASPSPVEKRLTQMAQQWLEATAEPDARILIWRVPGNAERMVTAFCEAQRAEAVAPVPDLFLRFAEPFETGFSYSRRLTEALIERYTASVDSFKQQGIAFDWPFARLPRADSAAGFMQVLGSFAGHHQAHLRSTVAVLTPSPVSSADALDTWLRAALAGGLPPAVRLMLVDNPERARWQWLEREQQRFVRVLAPPLDMFDLARETAAQSPGKGPAVAYRQLLADVLTLVERGTPAQVQARADKALAIAGRERWPDQQVVLHMAVAGAHQKAGDDAAAIASYRRAREHAAQARAQAHPAGDELLMQTWFGEAGVWLMERQYRRAADAYREAARVAQLRPQRLMALEALRMAAFCHARDGDPASAREMGALALREGKAMVPAERPQTTLGMALHDQLLLQDEPRARQLEQAAETYRQALADAQADADRQAQALGSQPRDADVDRIESALDARLEAAFEQLRRTREQAIAGGDEYFRRIVAAGRELLHPHWSGLPEVKHPLDKAQAIWTQLPDSAALPPVGDLARDDEEATA